MRNIYYTIDRPVTPVAYAVNVHITSAIILQRLIELRFYVLFTRHKIGHFGDVLPSQLLGLVLKQEGRAVAGNHRVIQGTCTESLHLIIGQT